MAYWPLCIQWYQGSSRKYFLIEVSDWQIETLKEVMCSILEAMLFQMAGLLMLESRKNQPRDILL